MTRKMTLSEKMRFRITLQTEQKTSDDAGGYTLSWTNVATVWAAIESASRRASSTENVVAGQLENRSFFVFTIRYRDGVTSKMRVLYNSRVFNIRRVINVDERKQWIEIFATEGEAV